MYRDIDTLDPTEREKHRKLTEALWAQLERNGIRAGDEGRIEVFFLDGSQQSAEALAQGYRRHGFEATVIPPNTGEQGFAARIVTPRCRFTIEAFLDLTDITLFAAREHAMKLDGLQVDSRAVRRPSLLDRILRCFFGPGPG
jgi:hypothetical protein